MSTRYLAMRLAQSALLLFVVMVVVFLLLHVTPTDPVEMLMAGHGTRQDVETMKERLGFNKPLVTQFLNYLAGALRLDFGTSIRSHRPVLAMVTERLPATLELTAVAFLLASTAGILLGTLCAFWKDSAFDNTVRLVALTAQSMPAYWLGLMLIVLFAVKLGIVPTSGRGSLSHIILPAVTLTMFLVGLVIRLTRSEVLEILGQDYVRTARSKGLPERIVVYRHILRNAMIPVMTVLGLQVGTLLGGAVVTETVFAWPGIGDLAVTALMQRDYPVVQGVVLMSAAMFIFINFAVDFLYARVDPRIKEV